MARMSKKQMRIEIAKDVLAKLRENNFHVSCGVYVQLSDEADDWFYEHERSYYPAQKHLDKIVPECRACALGSMLISYVDKFNKVTLGEIVDNPSNTCFTQLEKCFSYKQLKLIERTFECWCTGDDPDEDTAILNFTQKHFDARKRLAAIMKNIVKNEGTFILPGYSNE